MTKKANQDKQKIKRWNSNIFYVFGFYVGFNQIAEPLSITLQKNRKAIKNHTVRGVTISSLILEGTLAIYKD